MTEYKLQGWVARDDCIGDTVQIVDIIKPIYNFKAKTPEKPDWKAQKHKVVK